MAVFNWVCQSNWHAVYVDLKTSGREASPMGNCYDLYMGFDQNVCHVGSPWQVCPCKHQNQLVPRRCKGGFTLNDRTVISGCKLLGSLGSWLWWTVFISVHVSHRVLTRIEGFMTSRTWKSVVTRASKALNLHPFPLNDEPLSAISHKGGSCSPQLTSVDHSSDNLQSQAAQATSLSTGKSADRPIATTCHPGRPTVSPLASLCTKSSAGGIVAGIWPWRGKKTYDFAFFLMEEINKEHVSWWNDFIILLYSVHGWNGGQPRLTHSPTIHPRMPGLSMRKHTWLIIILHPIHFRREPIVLHMSQD